MRTAVTRMMVKANWPAWRTARKARQRRMSPRSRQYQSTQDGTFVERDKRTLNESSMYDVLSRFTASMLANQSEASALLPIISGMVRAGDHINSSRFWPLEKMAEWLRALNALPSAHLAQTPMSYTFPASAPILYVDPSGEDGLIPVLQSEQRARSVLVLTAICILREYGWKTESAILLAWYDDGRIRTGRLYGDAGKAWLLSEGITLDLEYLKENYDSPVFVAATLLHEYSHITYGRWTTAHNYQWLWGTTDIAELQEDQFYARDLILRRQRNCSPCPPRSQTIPRDKKQYIACICQREAERML